jgi:hypothetical protein
MLPDHRYLLELGQDQVLALEKGLVVLELVELGKLLGPTSDGSRDHSTMNQ